MNPKLLRAFFQGLTVKAAWYESLADKLRDDPCKENYFTGAKQGIEATLQLASHLGLYDVTVSDAPQATDNGQDTEQDEARLTDITRCRYCEKIVFTGVASESVWAFCGMECLKEWRILANAVAGVA